MKNKTIKDFVFEHPIVTLLIVTCVASAAENIAHDIIVSKTNTAMINNSY